MVQSTASAALKSDPRSSGCPGNIAHQGAPPVLGAPPNAGAIDRISLVAAWGRVHYDVITVNAYKLQRRMQEGQ
jgi:hypothetical protein